MSRPSQTENVYVQTIPDGKCLGSNSPRQKEPIFRLLCVHKSFMRSYPEFRVLIRPFVRSYTDVCTLNSLSCVLRLSGPSIFDTLGVNSFVSDLKQGLSIFWKFLNAVTDKRKVWYNFWQKYFYSTKELLRLNSILMALRFLFLSICFLENKTSIYLSIALYLILPL